MIPGAMIPGGVATPGTPTRAVREDAATGLRVGAAATAAASRPDPAAATATVAPGRPDARATDARATAPRPDPTRTLVD